MIVIGQIVYEHVLRVGDWYDIMMTVTSKQNPQHDLIFYSYCSLTIVYQQYFIYSIKLYKQVNNLDILISAKYSLTAEQKMSPIC